MLFSEKNAQPDKFSLAHCLIMKKNQKKPDSRHFFFQHLAILLFFKYFPLLFHTSFFMQVLPPLAPAAVSSA